MAVRRDVESKDRQLLTAQQQVLSRNKFYLLSLTFCVNNHTIFIRTVTKQGPADPRKEPGFTPHAATGMGLSVVHKYTIVPKNFARKFVGNFADSEINLQKLIE